MVDREAAERDTKRLTTRLKFAALRQNAVVEDVDLRTPRGTTAPYSKARRRRLDRTRRRAFNHRADRRRQKLDCLRSRPQGLPGWEKRPLPSGAAPVRGVGAAAATAAMAACSKPSRASSS